MSRNNDKMFRKMFELGLDMINLVDAEGKISYTSPATPDVLGYSPEEMLGMGLFDLVHPDDTPRAQTLLQDILTRPGQRLQVEMRLNNKDGQWQWMRIGVTNLLNDPDVAAIVTQGRDITERIRAERVLRNYTTELESRIRQRTDELQRTVNMMAGREFRIAELKQSIRELRAQLQHAGIEPVANDPLLEEE